MRYILLFLIVLIVSTGCKSEPPVTSNGEKIKIGVLAPLSGNNRALGQSGLKGVQLGKLLSPVFLTGNIAEIVVEDDKNDPDIAKGAFVKLVEEDKVSAVLVLSVNKAMLAVVEVARQYQTPVLAVMSSHPDITENGWVSQLIFDDNLQAHVAASFARDELLVDSAAVLRDDSDTHSIILATEFTKHFTETGGQVESIDYSSERDDLQTVIQRLQSSGIEILYLPLKSEDIVKINKLAQEEGYSPEVMVGDGVLSQLILSFPDDVEYLEGVYATDIFSHDLPPTKYGKKAIKAFGKTFDGRGSTFAALGCEGALVLLSAMNRCGENGNSTCIKSNLRNNSDIQGLLGKIGISRDGKAVRPVFINRIVGDKMSMVVTVY